jgi:Spy/CpxP family protein refolding chaperone
VLVVVGLLAGPILAQADAPRPEGPRPEARRGPGMGDPAERAKMIYERLIKELKDLGLTAEQEAQVKTIFDSAQQAQANWMKDHAEELKAAQAKMDEARKSGNEKAMQEARDAFGKVMESRKETEDNMWKQLAGVLNEKQLEKAKEILRSPMGMRRAPGEALKEALGKLDLSEEQKTKVNEILEAAKAEADKIQDPRERFRALEGVVDKVKAVLTPEQKTKLDELLRAGRGPGMGGPMAALNLTEDQKKQADEIMKAAREKAEKAEPDARREVYRAAMQEIADKVLTPEQKKQWEEMRARFQDRGGREGGRRGPGGEGGPPRDGGTEKPKTE